MEIAKNVDFKLCETKCDRETKICEIYSRILYRNFELTSKSFTSSVEEILNSSKGLSSKHLNDPPDFQCAYLFQLGIHDTCMVIECFYELIKQYPSAINTFKGRKCIDICCFGSAAILEAVGLCYAVDTLLIKYGIDQERCKICKRKAKVCEGCQQRISLTVIDEAEDLNPVSIDILSSFFNRFHAIRLENLEFINHNFSAPFTKFIRHAIHEATVVTMVKFLSSCPSSSRDGIINVRNFYALYKILKLIIFHYCIVIKFYIYLKLTL